MSDNKKTPVPSPKELYSNQNEIYGSNLLGRPHPEGYSEEWVESLKHHTIEESIPRQSLLVFRIQGEWLALPSHCIKEVTKATFIHTLPHTNSNVLLGISNIQGELLVAISMQNLLGIPNSTEAPKKSHDFSRYARNVVFGSGKNVFVFPVDEIHGLTYIKLDKIESVPMSILKSLKNYFSGIFALPEETLSIGLLDERLIIDSLNENYL